MSTISYKQNSSIGSTVSQSQSTCPDKPSPARDDFSAKEIIEISSDSEPSTPISDGDNSHQLTLHYLHQRYSNHFGCSNHFSTTTSSSLPSSHITLSEVIRQLHQNLPAEYPVPGEYGYSGTITEDKWLKLLCGVSTIEATPPALKIALQNSTEEFHTTYDIDSFIAKAKCLSVAKRGLRIQFAPRCLHNISSDLHLYSTIEERLLSGNNISHKVPLHHIPHFYLGLIPSSLHLPLYVFLPSLWNSSTSQSSYISNHHLQQWIDHIFIPAILRHYPTDLTQHLPVSFNSASMKIFARGRELGTQSGRFESGKRQELHYFLPGRYLKQVWVDIIESSQKPANKHFENVFLLIDAKDLKLHLKSSTINGSWQLFTDMLDGDLDFKSLDSSFQFLDLGQEIFSEQEKSICFFKTCCLNQALAQIRAESSGLKATNYTWALTALTSNQTLAYSKVSQQYQSGLIYSQFYSPIKSLLDAAGTYPFQNQSLNYLSISSDILKMWQSGGISGERFKIDIDKLQKAYTHSRDRILLALREAIQQGRSFGSRQEHRISIEIFHALAENSHGISSEPVLQNCLIMNSEEIFHFLYANICRFGLALEYTATKLNISNNESSVDLSRIFRMFLQLQRASCTSSLLQAQGDLWKSYSNSGDQMRYGLGLKNQLENFNFCWLSPFLLNWKTWSPEHAFSASTAFNYIPIHKSALGKTRHLLTQKTELEILERFARLLREIQDPSSHITYRILAFLGTMVIQKFRSDIWSALLKYCEPEWKDDIESKKAKALSGLLPLDYENVIGYSPSHFSRVKYSNKHKLTLQERWEILFHSDDKWDQQDLRKAWKEKPFRILFQKCYNTIVTTCDLETARYWEYLLLQTQFARSNFLLPSPSKHSFLQKLSQKGQPSRIYWVLIKHNSWEMSSSIRTLPERNSEQDKWQYWSLDYTFPIPTEYQSPDSLFLEHLKSSDVLERLEHRWIRSKLSC